MNSKFPDIDGKLVETNIFEGFQILETIIEKDRPRLFIACSPLGERWLFKWCESDESSQLERWLAFQISDSRLDALKNGGLSLREAITLPQNNFYVFETEAMFNPTMILKSFPELLPMEYLPSVDVSINGKFLGLKPREDETLTVRLHVFSKFMSELRCPLSIVGRLQNVFQEYMTWVAHSFDTESGETVLPSFKDWTGFDLAHISSGSFTMECISNSNRQETKKLTKACQLLENLPKGILTTELVEPDFARPLSSDILRVFSLLAYFISSFDMSVSVMWVSSDTPSGYVAFDKRRADSFLKQIKSLQNKEQDSITIKLSPEEADPLRRYVRGDGGWQNLVRKLGSNLTADNKLELAPSDIEKILRYSLLYGQGGFQNQLDGIAMKLKRIGVPFNIA